MISDSFKKVLDVLRTHSDTASEGVGGGPRVSVNQITKKVGVFYEKVRYLVDYKKEHAIKRSAVERILKRKIAIEQSGKIGESLLN